MHDFPYHRLTKFDIFDKELRDQMGKENAEAGWLVVVYLGTLELWSSGLIQTTH